MQEKRPTRCDKLLIFIHSTCFGHHYAHHQEYKPGSCLCCEMLAVVCVYCYCMCVLLLYVCTAVVCVYCCCMCVLLLYVCTSVVCGRTTSSEQYTHTTA